MRLAPSHSHMCLCVSVCGGKWQKDLAECESHRYGLTIPVIVLACWNNIFADSHVEKAAHFCWPPWVVSEAGDGGSVV